MKRNVRAVWLGTTPYDDVHALQQRMVTARIAGTLPDTLLFLEHEPVVTLGRGAKAENVLSGPDELRAEGTDFVETGRGGDATVHNPGQLVCYPIFDLKPDRCDVRKYVRDLGSVMTGLASLHGIDAQLLPEFIGVWVNLDSKGAFGPTEASAKRPSRMAKLGAIGVRLSRWVTMHGFALNIENDLTLFDRIVPCGIREHGVTSLQKLGIQTTPRALVEPAMDLFAHTFDADVTLATRAWLDATLT